MPADTEWRELRVAVEQAAAAGRVPELLCAARALLALDRGADVSFCATLFRRSGDLLIAHGHRTVKAFLVRSVTVEPLLGALQVQAVLNGYVLEVQVGGYGSYMEEMLTPGGALGRAEVDVAFLLLDAEEIAGGLPALCASGQAEVVAAAVEAAVDRVEQMVRAYRGFGRARLVVQGCVLPAETSSGMVGEANLPHSLVNALRDVNRGLAIMCGAVADCAFFDVDEVAARHGRERWRDQRMFLASRLAVAPGAFGAFARGLLRTASAMLRPARKVLCTDLDNTLWGGVLGEDGPGGIATGSAFPGNCYLAYQHYLRGLAARGILLAIASKNNPADVDEAFRLRSADLALTLDAFVARRIGWNEKVDALREMAAELSLGLDAFVFVDDNPMECEAVRQHLPEVAVIEVPVREPWSLVGQLAAAWFFDAVSVTADDRNRSQEYKAQAERATLRRDAASRDEFLGSLGIVCTFGSAAEAPLERAVQLLAKTNQFNLTTRRHGSAAVMEFANDPECQAIAVRVRDRFGDAGVVGLALTRQVSDECWIDTMLLSCRVIGRGIETAILSVVAQRAAAMGARTLIGEYVESKKNVPCRDFYPEHGFDRQDVSPAEGTAVYRLELAKAMPECPPWLSLEGLETYELAASAVVPA